MDQVIIAGPERRGQLLDRRRVVELEIAREGSSEDLTRHLRDVEDALARLENGSYGLCETCHDPIETDRVLADPLVRFCLDHLSEGEQRALEHDLELAARVQRGLLPIAHARVNGWEIAYHYEPAGVVSGDYCDYISTDAADLYFVIGDVSGKGVAASMLMSHLRATFRTLIQMQLSLAELMARTSRLFGESALPAQYATLVSGKTTRGGELEICNAGHPPPLLIREAGVDRIEATGLPAGMFHSEKFDVVRARLMPGDTLLLYTDGVLEASDGHGVEYGSERLVAIGARSRPFGLQQMVSACVKDLAAFRSSARRDDDVTVMAIRWHGHEA
jgi:sigma-B regulation protein RsbU (phosphoserine phosphatase)